MHLRRRVYLDWASAAPVSWPARRAFFAALGAFGNPQAPHAEGRRASRILEEARGAVAALAQAKADAVIFTGGATEANNIAIQGVVKARVQKDHKAHVLYLPTAHASTVETVEALKGDSVQVEALTLTNDAIDLAALAGQLRPDTVLVCMDRICGETGTRYDTRAVRRVLTTYEKKAGTKIVLHVDAAQAPLVESFELTRLGADTLVLDAQKVGGVRGIGALIAPRSVPIAPIIHGGGQERTVRSGTQSHALAAAFAAALTHSATERDGFVERATSMRAFLIEHLSYIRNVVVNEAKEHAPHILNVSLIGRDTDYLVALLDAGDFAVSTKSACETGAEGSRVVLAATGDSARAASTLRVSWGPRTRASDVRAFAKTLASAVRFLDEHAL